MTFRWALLAVTLSGSWVLVLPAWADPCSGGTMPGIISNMVPLWNPPPGKIGIRALFDGYCESCHDSDTSFPGNRYKPCSTCHQAPYPPYLSFRPSGSGDVAIPPALLMRSYYAPGYNKAWASIIRAKDGTMSPPHSDNARPWCDGIVSVYQQWLDAGYPVNP